MPLTQGGIPASGAKQRVGSDTDNSKILTEQTWRPTTRDNVNYTPILQKNIYEFMDDAYYGEGGFFDGRYLVPHTREIFYEDRRQNVFYKNYLFSIINAMLDPVFGEEIKREVRVLDKVVEDGMFIHGFIKNADNSGHKLHKFMDEATTAARLHGVTFVIVDNFREQPPDKKTAIAQRNFPYVHIKRASVLNDFKTDDFGNLIWIEFNEDPVDVEGIEGFLFFKNKIVRKEKRISRWDNEKWQLFGINTKGERFLIDSFEHGLDVIPVIPVFSTVRRNVREIEVQPPFYDLARINTAMFNKDSEIRDQERAQGFAVFYMQSDKPGDTSIGTHNIVWLPMGTTIPPDFASPDPAILAGLIDSNEKLRDDLFRIAGQKGVIAIEKKESGIAKQWDFIAHETSLKKTSMIASTLEHKIIEIFKLYTPNEPFEYIVEYPDSFAPENDAQELEDFDKLLLMELPAKATLLIKRMAFETKVEKKKDDPKVMEAIEEFEKIGEDQSRTDLEDREKNGTDG